MKLLDRFRPESDTEHSILRRWNTHAASWVAVGYAAMVGGVAVGEAGASIGFDVMAAGVPVLAAGALALFGGFLTENYLDGRNEE